MHYQILIDTSKPESYVALVGDKQLLAKKEWKSDRTMSEKLLKYIDKMLKEHELVLSQIARYGVQTGPGHFSALRTGVAMATMLAYANNAELVAIKSRDTEDQLKDLLTGLPADTIDIVYE